MRVCAAASRRACGAKTRAAKPPAGKPVYQPMSPIDMRLTLIRLGIAAIFLVAGLLLRQAGVAFALYLIAYLITVLPVAAKVAYHFTHGKYFDEYLLILIASLGAFLLRHYPEASLVLILHSAGQIAGDLVLSSTHKSMTRQTITVPDKASLVNMKGEEHQVSPKEIRIGNFVLVRSGERIRSTALCCAEKGLWMTLCSPATASRFRWKRISMCLPAVFTPAR